MFKELGAWNTTTVLPADTISYATSVTYNGYVYVIGGDNKIESYLDTVYYAKLNTDGTIGKWLTTTSLPDTISYATSVTYNGYVYVMGGDNGNYLDTVYYAKLNNDGTVGKWLTTTSLPDTIAGATSVTYNGYVYLMGGTGSRFEQLDTVYYAQFKLDGSIDTWLTTTSLPSIIVSARSVIYKDYVYVIGGYTGNEFTLDTVYYAQFKSNGSVGKWLTTTSLPISIDFLTSVMYNDYIYVMGGTNVSGDTAAGQGVYTVLNTVYYSKLNTDGTIGKWLTTTSLPDTISYATSVTYNGYVYVMGGGNGDVVFNTVYYAQLSPPTPPISNICFPAGTPIKTDQGLVMIEHIDTKKHTIQGESILHVTQTVTLDKYLIAFPPHSISKNYPTHRTLMSKDHQIMYKGQLVPAYRFLNYSKAITKVMYSGEVLYNVLLASHSTMTVNNLICETLSPENIIAKLYLNNYDDTYKEEMINAMNESLLMRDLPTYKHIIRSL